MVGSFDDGQYGNRVDLASGEESAQGSLLSSDVMGATLLRLADLDPRSEGIEADAIEGMLG